MDKPIVHYQGPAVAHGDRAFLLPVDHPNHLPDHSVSNTKPVTTSKVVSWDKATGVIETANTIYTPV